MSRRGRKGRQEDLFRVLISIFILVVLASLASGAGYRWWINQPAGLDKRLCPKNGIKGHTIILIDKTDPLDRINPLLNSQKAALDQLIVEVAHRHSTTYQKPTSSEMPVAVGELLTIFVLGDDYKTTPEPVFSRCNPGLGNDANIFLANQEKLESLYRREYDNPLKESQNKFASSASSQWSPIMEMLQLVAINGFKHEAAHGSRRLIIISDMLHNSPAFSLFKQKPDFASFQNTPYFQQVRTDLAGVSVDIRYLMFSPALQTNSLTYFWEGYLRSTGASINSAKPL